MPFWYRLIQVVLKKATKHAFNSQNIKYTWLTLKLTRGHNYKQTSVWQRFVSSVACQLSTVRAHYFYISYRVSRLLGNNSNNNLYSPVCKNLQQIWKLEMLQLWCRNVKTAECCVSSFWVKALYVATFGWSRFSGLCVGSPAMPENAEFS